jgi:sarcosine oxidase subunit alpha
LDRLLAAGVPVLTGRTLQAALGKKQVSGAVTVALDADGRPQPGTEQTIACDLICVSAGRAAANGLLYQSGCRLEFDARSGMFIPARLAPNVYAAGGVAGPQALGACLAAGRAAGIQAAQNADGGWRIGRQQTADSRRQTADDPSVVRRPSSVVHDPPSAIETVPSAGKRKFVCFCMDVTEKDLHDAVREGFDEIELLKRYATAGMGPCQGKMCGMGNIAACARETGKTIAATGTTTSRPPAQPVTLGALAGASHHPVKRTPMHDRHLALGARMMDMGEWKRPLYYCGMRRAEQTADGGRQTADGGRRTKDGGRRMADGGDRSSVLRPSSSVFSALPIPHSAIEGEYRAVRERVGLIDVSTLGKLDVKGRDAGKLLDRVYTHVFSSLSPGRTRYAVICDDAGIILDDGTVTRLADDHYFITTTTGNIEFVEQWLGWWAAGTRLCVHVTNVTAGYASVNLAGPEARATLGKLTGLDLSPPAFPSMAAAQATVAGVPALLVRLGFVGETGWEIHAAAECGEALWVALLEAGQEFGIAPFGVEAQRLLRLEKKHLIVGVDTDALTNPLEAGMAWVIRWEKQDFIGKRSLARIRERGLRNMLVGFLVRDAAVPPDGSAVVRDGALIGRVTSCRYSPHSGRAIGLAWVPVERSAPGASIEILTDGRAVMAEVVDRAFYDPEGARLRA